MFFSEIYKYTMNIINTVKRLNILMYSTTVLSLAWACLVSRCLDCAVTVKDGQDPTSKHPAENCNVDCQKHYCLAW